jgi:GH24 family phage-related lysozyme (muramidase)
VLCVAVAGAAVAATGGFSRILNNFTGTVETLDGETYHIENGKLVDGQGNVIGTATVEIAAD